MIDFSIVIHAEAGTVESRAELRSWMKYLSQFAHSLDIVRATPRGDWLLGKPGGVMECTLAVEGEEYAIYLADPREVEDTNHGAPISGAIRFLLPEGEYSLATFSPTPGGYSPAIHVSGGAETTFDLLPFHHDIVVRLTQLKS
jgi:hypothetical protein